MLGADVPDMGINGGKFLSNSLLFGVKVSPNFALSRHQNTNLNVSVSPFLRYYFGAKEGMQSGKFYFYTQARVGYRLNFNTKATSSVNHNFTPSIGLGATYFINERVSVDARYNISNDLGDFSHPYKFTPIYGNLEFGLQIHLPGKKLKERLKAE